MAPVPLHPSSTLAPGAHTFDSDGITQRYHVYGRGPVCLAHPGGPGIHWNTCVSASSRST